MVEAAYQTKTENDVPAPEEQNSRRAERESSMRPRPVDYDWSQLPVHWYKNDPQLTHTVNVLNLLLPEGETWFVRVFVACLPYVEDNHDLRMDVRGFMGQESHHANAHQELLDYLDEHDIATKEYTDFIEWLLQTPLGEDPFGYEIRGEKQKRFWNTFRLAGVAALEHVTAFLGAWALNAERLDDEDVDQVMVDLIRWHGAEEVEHQSVALDLLEEVAPRTHHLWRTFGFAIAFPALFYAWVDGVRFLMAQDDRIDEGPTWKRHFEAVKNKTLPSIWNLLKTTPRLMNPNYDPYEVEKENMQKAIAQIQKSHGAHML
jgi:predicted metal-dependent hydrolase